MITLSLTVSAQHDHSGMGTSSGPSMKMNMDSNMNMVSEKTATLKVWGKCGLCKERIEKTAISGGASIADWNIKTKFLAITYNPVKTNVEYLSEKLAKAGHDTGLNSTKDKAFNALPDCCKYERIR